MNFSLPNILAGWFPSEAEALSALPNGAEDGDSPTEAITLPPSVTDAA